MQIEFDLESLISLLNFPSCAFLKNRLASEIR
jgi:hypothetical protein